MANIYDIQNFLKEILDPDEMSDYGINGIQVENDGSNINNIAFAVDASIASIEKTISNNCNLLIVHHGFYWGKPLPITGNFKKRIKLLLDNNIGIIAYHLPLDAHSEYGNNITILKKISKTFSNISPFGSYHNNFIGWKVDLEKSISIEEIYKNLNLKPNDSTIKYLSFGNNEITKIAVVSGGGSFSINEAINNDIDLLITGDPDHTLYHTAKENNINILFAGHYFTETFGIKAIQEVIENKFKISTIFLDIPTGL
jgi:dinuclear metal center YbgI/SA1388 family protein